jgi:FkbM family methyltransferase
MFALTRRWRVCLRGRSVTFLGEQSNEIRSQAAGEWVHIDLTDVFSRYRLLMRRMRRAKELEFSFIGTTYSRMPHHLRLFNRTIGVTYPNDPTLLSDVINILLDDEYGLRSICGPVKTVVDIGANIGIFSLWARHNFPGATIHAYEPNEEIFNYAVENLKEATVMLFNEGVSNESTTGTLVQKESSRLGKTRKESLGRIKLTDIDTVIERVGGKLDILKLDCEGAEWEIFQRSAVFQGVSQIRMEYHFDGFGYELAKLDEVASKLGFQIIKIIPHGEFGIAWLKKFA